MADLLPFSNFSGTKSRTRASIYNGALMQKNDFEQNFKDLKLQKTSFL
jgi:hypothetical protein